MNKIKSFQIDHDILVPGLYVSRVDGDIVTYDIRVKKPNCGDYLSNGAMHTIEHLFATYVRNSAFWDEIVYFGPMGCRTGFYFLVRDGMNQKQVIKLVRDTFEFISTFEGEIPGARRIECGNYLEHDLAGAREEARAMLAIVAHWTEAQLNYPERQ